MIVLDTAMQQFIRRLSSGLGLPADFSPASSLPRLNPLAARLP